MTGPARRPPLADRLAAAGLLVGLAGFPLGLAISSAVILTTSAVMALLLLAAASAARPRP